jgi:hypothetical protein
VEKKKNPVNGRTPPAGSLFAAGAMLPLSREVFRLLQNGGSRGFLESSQRFPYNG